MRTQILKHTWKSAASFVYAYGMVTLNYTIEDILEFKKSGGKIVFFGSEHESYTSWSILSEHGIQADYIVDLTCTKSFKMNGISVRPYWKVLKEPEKYYFIITLKNQYQISEAIKQLLHAGVDEFGVMLSGWTKDFQSSSDPKLLQDAYYTSVNEVFKQIEFGNDSEFENMRRATFEGAAHFDILYIWIYESNKKAKNVTCCEIGAGAGTLSFSLKKLLDIDITWTVMPEDDLILWQESKTDYFVSLLKKYNINTLLGSIESGHFSEREQNTISSHSPTDTGKFDIIIMSQVMEHFIYNPVSTFKNLAGMLNDSGFLYVSTPLEILHHNVRHWRDMPCYDDLSAAERQRREKINNYGHFHEYTYQELVEVFEESGFEVSSYVFTAPNHYFMLCKNKS